MLARFFRYLVDIIRIVQLPDEQRVLTIYSEGSNYWPHLESLASELLNRDKVDICYISSDPNDPGLSLENARWFAFQTDEGFFRNWLFENIDTRFMLMTMPDLNKYQVKRSKNPVQYIYVQHSLVSLHMIYRTGAFDFYDHIFCAGPHHLKEMRALEKQRGLPAKNLVKHGYERLDQLLVKADSASKQLERSRTHQHHVLIAPSWSQEGIIESGFGYELVGRLLELKCRVFLRPHPQTIKLASNEINNILSQFASSPLFSYEGNVAGSRSLFESSLMISDWSGVALDYALSQSKPVLFIDVPRKINNPEFAKISLEPIEVTIRSQIGEVVPPDVSEITSELLDGLVKKSVDANSFVYNIRNSSLAGADHIIALLEAK